jgi:hypothetical protein
MTRMAAVHRRRGRRRVGRGRPMGEEALGAGESGPEEAHAAAEDDLRARLGGGG